MSKDPYLYPDTQILINKLNIRDDELLQQMEVNLVALRLKEDLPKGQFDYTHLKALHYHLFQDLYAWAGQERTIRMSKGTSQFAFPEYIQKELDKLFHQLKSDHYLRGLDPETFAKKAAEYFNEVNAAHPFREGNGRTNRIFFKQLAQEAGYEIAWYKTSSREFIDASIAGFQGDNQPMAAIFVKVLITPEKELSPDKTKDISLDQEEC